MKKIVGFFVCLLCLGFAGTAVAQTQVSETVPQKNRATSAQGNTAALAQDAATVTLPDTPEVQEIRAAAERGDTNAQEKLGDMYANLSGNPADKQAIEWYRKAVEQKNVTVQWMLAWGLSDEWGRKASEASRRAFMKIRAAAERGDANAQKNLGYIYGLGNRSDKQSIEWYRKAAEQGNVDAQRKLAWLLDGDEAAEWRRKAEETSPRAFMKTRAAAEQGNADAQYEVGRCYDDRSKGWTSAICNLEESMGVASDRKQAIVWYRKAAEQGNLDAQRELGWSLKGDEAVEWMRKAAEGGEPSAQYRLGLRYLEGDGVAKDAALAVEWFRKAAERGFDDAAYQLGYMYRDGKGVAQDDAQAVAWFRKALSISQQALGDMYIQWRGIAPDREQAIAWIRKAASEGDSVAQYALGEMYLSGKGVKQDREQAVFWLKKAAREGDGNGPASDALICLGEAETDGCDADDGD